MLKVLVADDSALILKRLEDMLNTHKEVEIVGLVNNGTDALALLKAHKPDLAIVDLMMPGLNGLEVLSKIRKQKQALTFILLTFSSAYFYRHLALGSGADYFFTKSEGFGQVSLVVADCIKKNSLVNLEKARIDS